MRAPHPHARRIQRERPRDMHRELPLSGPEHRPAVAEIEHVVGPPIVEPRRALEHVAHLAANHPRDPDQPMIVRSPPPSGTGMKSQTSPTPPGVMNRVISTALPGKYSCLETYPGSAGASRNLPPRSGSSSEANTLGESKRGLQNQSISPSVVTSAAVCRSPISP